MNPWKIQIRPVIGKMGREIIIYREIGNKIEMIQGDIITTIEEGCPYEKPSLYLHDDMFQALVDYIHLAHKPTEGRFIEGKLAGVEAHLEDMRKLVFMEPVIINKEVK